jgi:hypothetical protein
MHINKSNPINQGFLKGVFFSDAVSDILARFVSMFIGFWGGRAFFDLKAHNSLYEIKINMLIIGASASVILIMPIIDKLRENTRKG